MNYKMLARLNGYILLIEAVFMLPALFISIYDHENVAIVAFLTTIALILVTAGLLMLISKGAKKGFYAREGLVCTGLAWIVMSLLGGLPFYFSREIPRYVDCFFEVVSGFTTTGASIVPNVESLSRGILYWRSFTHWVGGMGVLVFLLAIVPSSGRGNGFTLHLLRAESPGPSVGKIVPKMRQTAMILYLMYIGLTVLNIVFLLLGGMPLFESVCHAFGTAGTGGFGVKADSFASYSPYLQNVTTVFMLLFGVNFSCYYLILLKDFKSLFKDEELRLYLGIVVVAALLIAVNVRNMYPTLEETLRQSFFQVASIITTTGYATTDFDLWPSFSKTIILALMVIGASAGSTGGGLKCARLMLLMKGLRRNIRTVLHPREVQVVRVNNRVVDEKILANTNAYLTAYIIIIMLSMLLISLDGFSTETNFSAILCTFNNIGPGLGQVGPTCNFADYSAFSKIVLSFDMLAGRLEIFPILALFSRTTWKKM